MDHASLSALRSRIRPVELRGSFTLEQASAAVAVNRDVARFHAAVAQAERILEIVGELDVRLEHELAARALDLVRARSRVEHELRLRADRARPT